MNEFVIDVSGLPEVQKMLGELQGQKMNARTRRALRAAVKEFRGPLRQNARAGRFPKKFKRTRTRSHRNPAGISISPGSPLSTIFEHGARPHAIPIRRGPFAGRTVQHPGMAARPLIVPVFEANVRKAENAFVRTLTDGL